MSRFTSEQVREAVVAYLRGIGDEDTTYDVQDCRVHGDEVRICIGSLSEDVAPELSYNGVEGDMSDYEGYSLEDMIEDMLGGGPSIQSTTMAEVNEWVARRI